MAYAHENYEISTGTELFRRMQRDKIRQLIRDSGGPKEKLALRMAESGYGCVDVHVRAGVTSELARKIVLGS